MNAYIRGCIAISHLVLAALSVTGCSGAISAIDAGPSDDAGEAADTSLAQDAPTLALDAGLSVAQPDAAGVDVESLAGTYTGTYGGQDNGTITLTIQPSASWPSPRTAISGATSREAGP